MQPSQFQQKLLLAHKTERICEIISRDKGEKAQKEKEEQTPVLTKLGRKAETEHRCVFKGAESSPAALLFPQQAAICREKHNITKQA